jgi:hypothetical protein
MKLPLIPLDKANHIIYGIAIYILANLLLIEMLAFLVVMLFGIAKELYDFKSYGKFDILDLLATISGAAILTIIYR